MKKKHLLIMLPVLAIIAIIIGLILSNKNKELSKNSIEIIDATYVCAEALEKFYEDSNYTYSFPCIQSDSIYVKFPNGNKMLVVDAIEQNKVTIEQLIKAGLKVYKEKK